MADAAHAMADGAPDRRPAADRPAATDRAAAADDRITVLVESRDSFAFAAACWFLHRLDPGAEAVLNVMNSRDPHTRRLVLLSHAASSTVWYRNAQLDYGVETSEPLSAETRPEPFRRLRLRATRDLITAFVTEALDLYRKHVTTRWSSDGDGVPYWSWDAETGMWSRGKDRRPRPLSTLFLPADAERLVADFKAFCSDESLARYRSLHVAPTRVYMLHGCPGSGKSSLIHCVASDTKHGVAVMTFSPGTTDDDLRHALSSLPPRCLLSIEDVDGLFVDGRRMVPGLTFAGLLAALDNAGLEEGAGTGIFLTTNALCTLDPALRRRVDMIQEFGFATKAQAQRLFSHFFPHSGVFEQLWQRLYGRQFAMSVLQKYLLKALQSGDPLKDFDQFDLLAQCAAGDHKTDVGHVYM
jgi:hypothetical protein